MPSNVPFDLVLGRLSLRRLGGVPDFEADEVRLDCHGQIAVPPTVSEYSQRLDPLESTDSEDFVSDSDGSESLPGEDKNFLP